MQRRQICTVNSTAGGKLGACGISNMPNLNEIAIKKWPIEALRCGGPYAAVISSLCVYLGMTRYRKNSTSLFRYLTEDVFEHHSFRILPIAPCPIC